jgi:predicted nucleic acid binding AN1-type Zn finger protein
MEFQNIGKHCEHSGCRQLDFLPFKCEGCRRTYCLEHRSLQSHSCPKQNTGDAQVPICLLCKQAVSCGKTEDINTVMEKHISGGCKTKEQLLIAFNRCRMPGCKKSELVPFNCSNCQSQFCSKHRSTFDHKCTSSREVNRKIGTSRIPVRVTS